MKEQRLEVKVAIAIDSNGTPLVGGDHDPYFHLKVGVIRDAAGDAVAFQGSANESASGWKRNFEAISVFTSWADGRHFDEWSTKFDAYWSGEVPGFRIYDLPEAVRERLIEAASSEPPPDGDVEVDVPDARTPFAHYLRVAPRLIHARGTVRGNERRQSAAAPATGLRSVGRRVSTIVASSRRGRSREDHLGRYVAAATRPVGASGASVDPRAGERVPAVAGRVVRKARVVGASDRRRQGARCTSRRHADGWTQARIRSRSHPW